ncbi:hypothetical protein PHYPSEUDO_008088 [Phytophthora pseudosyringae]|uniref:Histone-lysine N-methyltransferase, H3 lysine-79 specific n=1 Tax=Phytophthora pseudosyringae TaxID=221518 RepID=A0A8T1VHX6_9STRA|nr:hypothetical protein PHYPSEUDO_008088 [Phytophthora pseudosyringae]
MRTSFSDLEDKKLVVLVSEYERQGIRVVWKNVARKMPCSRPPKQLEMRLRALKRSYGKQLTRFPPCFFTSSTPPRPSAARFRLLLPSEAEKSVSNIFSDITAADVRQHVGKTEENAGELLPTTVSSIIKVVGQVERDDIFLDVGAGLGNVVTQFALQSNARQCLAIEKRRNVAQRGSECIRSHASRLLLLHKAQLIHGDVLDTPLSSSSPFQDASIIFLNDFLFEKAAKIVVVEELSRMRRARMIVSTSRYCPRHRHSCRRIFCMEWQLTKTFYGRASWKSAPLPIFTYSRRHPDKIASASKATC